MEKHNAEGNTSQDVLLVERTPKKSPPVLATPDLSTQIAMTVAKQKGERVKCRRIFGDNYRCNWLAPDDRAGHRGAGLPSMETYRIRDSKFLRVTKAGDSLVIEDVTAQTARNN